MLREQKFADAYDVRWVNAFDCLRYGHEQGATVDAGYCLDAPGLIPSGFMTDWAEIMFIIRGQA